MIKGKAFTSKTTMRFIFLNSSGLALIAVLASLLSFPYPTAYAQQPAASVTTVLARGPYQTQITAMDVLSELRQASASDREVFFSKPEMVQRLVGNLLVRRVLATEAQRAGLGEDALIAAAVAIARDRVISDAQLAVLDSKNTPDEIALEAYALNAYKAKPTRFETPAQTRARHILLPPDPASLQKAKELLTQLRSGASFEELAKTNSTDPGSAAKGGDLGFFPAGRMVKAFDDAVEKLMKPGDLSEPIETEFGYHIIRLEERKEKIVKPFSEVKDLLRLEAKANILKEFRQRLANDINKDFVFDTAAIGAMGETTK